jgi:hypothetical protein
VKSKRQFVERKILSKTYTGKDALREIKRRMLAQKNNPDKEVFGVEEFVKKWTSSEAWKGIQNAIRKRGWKRIKFEWIKSGIILHSTEGARADPLAFAWQSVERSMAKLAAAFEHASIEEKRMMEAAFDAGAEYMELLALKKTAVGVAAKPNRFAYLETCAVRLKNKGIKLTEKNIFEHCGDLVSEVRPSKIHRDLVEWRRRQKQT